MHETAKSGLTPGWFDEGLQVVSLLMEAAGIGAIALGAVMAVVVAVSCIASGGDTAAAYHRFSLALARGILLGLEFLLAADIIGTVAVEPTLQNLYVLGLIVLIRTFLSFSLEIEIDGRLPWRKASPESPRGDSF